MSDTPHRLFLVMLREMHAEMTLGLAELREGLREVRDRLHALEQGQVYVIRNLRPTRACLGNAPSCMAGSIAS